MLIDITSVTILRVRHGADQLILHTYLPDGAYPFEGTANLSVFVAKDTGEAYCKKNLPTVPVEVIEA